MLAYGLAILSRRFGLRITYGKWSAKTIGLLYVDCRCCKILRTILEFPEMEINRMFLLHLHYLSGNLIVPGVSIGYLNCRKVLNVLT